MNTFDIVPAAPEDEKKLLWLIDFSFLLAVKGRMIDKYNGGDEDFGFYATDLETIEAVILATFDCLEPYFPGGLGPAH